MPSYRMSNGERIDKREIDKRIKEAKKIVLQIQLNEHGYHFCTKCGISSGTRFDCAHLVPVKKCQDSGHAQEAWNVGNIVVMCRECHAKHDKLY